MDALMDNKKLTCRGCHNYVTPPLQVCSNDCAHLFCGKCKGKHEECVICNGKISDLSGRMQETFLAVKYPCKFHDRGCNAMLHLHEKSNHEYECNFKIFKCEFGRFCPKPCDWEGPYSAIQHHFRSQHVKFPFNKNPPLSIQMRIPGNSFNFIQMIHSYNELFWFKYRIDAEKQKVFFVLQLIGSKEQASEFSYELEIISLIDPNNAIHFTEKCFSDSENLSDIFELEQCAVTSFSKIKNFIVDNKLTFNFRIKKVKKFVKNQNQSANTENVQKQNDGKRNHHPRHNRRGKKGQRDNSKPRDNSTCSNDQKKVQNNDFEILNFKDLQAQLPPSSNHIGNKNRVDNFESVFLDKSQATNSASPAFQRNNNHSGVNYQQNLNKANSVRNIPNNLPPPPYQQRASFTSTGNNQIPSSTTSTRPPNPPYQQRTFPSTGDNQIPSSSQPSTRPPNYNANQSSYNYNAGAYNAQQSSQYRNPKERKPKKEDNCIIS